jgi:phosphoribosylglycinamide formyltransferase-1
MPGCRWRLRRSSAIALMPADWIWHAHTASLRWHWITHIMPYQPDLVVLAGYLRILSDCFVMHYATRLINIHPSLLPSFPGLDTHARALAAGVKVHGCTVHFVTTTLDHGPIILQAAVAVRADDTPATLAARVLAAEHCIYPRAIGWFAQGRLIQHDDGRVNLRDDSGSEQILFITESLS